MKKLFVTLLCVISLSPALMSQEVDLNARREIFIRDFIATYKAAYEKKQIDYIAKFFSDDALIITETKELAPIGKEIRTEVRNSKYKTLVEDRQTYVNRLKDVFELNTSIRLGISGLQISRHPKYPYVYGINFYQVWMDDGLGDNLEDDMPGFVFILINFKEHELTPIMHVRTWQPRNNITKPSEKYTIEDFRLLNY